MKHNSPLIKNERSHVLILSLDSLGDIVLRQPLLKGLLDEGHKVTVLVRDEYKDLLPFLDERLLVLSVDINPYSYIVGDHKKKFDELCSQISLISPDLFICAPFQRTFLDEWILKAFYTFQRIGFQGICFPYSRTMEEQLDLPDVDIFDHTIFCEEREPEVGKNRKLLTEVLNKEVNLYKPEMLLPQALVDKAVLLLSTLGLQRGRFIACCPSGTSNVQIKVWPAEKFSKVLVQLQQKHGLSILLLGHKTEKTVLEDISAMVTSSGGAAEIWLGNAGDISMLLGILSVSNFYFGNDTGSMHMAAALGRPVLAIFGGGTWPRFLPSSNNGVVLTQDLPCFYCRWAYCYFKDAPCVKMVAEESVINSANRLLEGKVVGVEVHKGAVLDTLSKELLSKLFAAVPPLENSRIINLHTLMWLENAIKEQKKIAEDRLQLIYEKGGEVTELQRSLSESQRANIERLELIYEKGGEVTELQRSLSESQRTNIERLELIYEKGREVTELKRRLYEVEGQLNLFEKLRGLDGLGWFLSLHARGSKGNRITNDEEYPNMISVIIPVYNAGPFLEECVTSVWGQEVSGWKVEIIVVDDGSTDMSLSLAQQMEKRSPVPMKVLRHPEGRNLGVSATRNLAIQNSKGAWIGMLDADDVWLPQKLKKQLEYIDTHPEVTMVCSYGYNVDVDGKSCTGWTGGPVAGDYSSVSSLFKAPYTFEQMLIGCPIVNSTVIARKKEYIAIGGYKEGMSQQMEDWLMWAQFSLKNDIHLLEEKLIKYRIHPQSWTTRYCVEGLAPTVRFEFFIELLFWMFSHENEYYRNKAKDVYKKYFPVFIKPIAEVLEENAAQGGSLNANIVLLRDNIMTLNQPLSLFANMWAVFRKMPGYNLGLKIARKLRLIS